MFIKRLLITFFLLLPINAFAADSTVTALTAASALNGTELFYCVQSGADRKCTGAQAGTYILASPVLTGIPTIPTPFTLGATSVTSTGTQLNYLNAATGTTGTTSTNIVFSTSPTLITPILGAATVTSINGNGITTGTGTLTLGSVTLNAGAGGTLGSYAFLSAGQLANSLGADVALNNTANYFDGPSVAQGTTGTWFASGTVTLTDTASIAGMFCKLWDGTSIINSATVNDTVIGNSSTISLSGFLTTPAANIRISCRDATATTGKILFNNSGNSKDSSLTVFRIN